jgi:chromosome segregation ATPase
MADQSGRLAAVAQKVERFEGKLTEVTNDLDPDDRREAGFASKIARARRDNDINDLANDLKTIGSIVGAQKRDFDRATQRNTDLEAENRNLRNEGGSAANLRREQQKNQDLTDRNQVLQGKVQDLEDDKRDLERQLRRGVPAPPNDGDWWQRNELDRLRRENAQLVADKANLQSRKVELKRERDALKAERDQLKEQKDALKQEVDAFDANWPRQTGCGDCKARRNHRCVRDMRFKKNKK